MWLPQNNQETSQNPPLKGVLLKIYQNLHKLIKGQMKQKISYFAWEYHFRLIAHKKADSEWKFFVVQANYNHEPSSHALGHVVLK